MNMVFSTTYCQYFYGVIIGNTTHIGPKLFLNLRSYDFQTSFCSEHTMNITTYIGIAHIIVSIDNLIYPALKCRAIAEKSLPGLEIPFRRYGRGSPVRTFRL